MSSFDSIPRGEFVLISFPVLVYSVFYKDPEIGSYPLSSECSGLLDDCRNGRKRGVITTASVARTWKLFTELDAQVSHMHDEPTEGAIGQTFIPQADHHLPKRISALLDCEIKIASILPTDFAPASHLVNELKLPISLAVDICAVIREFGLSTPLPVALPKPSSWPKNPRFTPHWCTDLPWQQKRFL